MTPTIDQEVHVIGVEGWVSGGSVFSIDKHPLGQKLLAGAVLL